MPGNPYVEFDVPAGTAKAICAFYPSIMGMPAEFLNGDNAVACVKAGKDQHLQFRETDRALPEFDGHHVQIYITGPYHRLRERGLISQEDNQHQYRFRDIIDLDGGRHLFTVEHEVRSATRPMFMRPLVNRNPAETNRTYAPGHEQWPYEGGVSSTPRPFDSIIAGSGILDHPPSRVMTAESCVRRDDGERLTSP